MHQPASQQPSVSELAERAQVDIWRIGDIRSVEVTDALVEIPADLVIVACYPDLIPAELYADRRFGGVNIHPSLLPDKRGPDPLFWVFRNGDSEAGVTIHQLTNEFDAGDIVAQEALPKPDGVSERDLETSLARIGSRLLNQTIVSLASGRNIGRPQCKVDITWASFPTAGDMVLTSADSARTVFNFIVGMRSRGIPIAMEIDGQHRIVSDVHGRWTEFAEPVDVPPGAQVVNFADGWVVMSFDD